MTPSGHIETAEQPTNGQSGTGRAPRRRWSIIVNLVLYQAGWFGTVLAAGAGRTGLAASIAVSAVAIHLLLARARRGEALLVLAAGAAGLVVDSLHVRLGVMEFSGPLLPLGLAPLWIIAMWMKFSITLHFCLHWLSGRYVLAALLGAVGGPLSFAAGARLGAAAFLPPLGAAYLIVGVAWGVALPLLVLLADRLAGHRGAGGSYRFEGEPGSASVS